MDLLGPRGKRIDDLGRQLRADVNILAAQMSQDSDGGGATVMLRLDRQVPGDVLSAIGSAVDATTLELVDLS